MKNLVKLICIIIWVCGIVIANGFWSTLFAVFIPFWSWYLVFEKLLTHNGII